MDLNVKHMIRNQLVRRDIADKKVLEAIEKVPGIFLWTRFNALSPTVIILFLLVMDKQSANPTLLHS
jgi:hypothetical protein